MSDLGLVLGGGGAHAAYQLGILAAIGERAPGVNFPIISGVSAGAINAAYIAGHRGSLSEAIAGLRHQWKSLTSERVYGLHSMVTGRSALRWLGETAAGLGRGLPAVHGVFDTKPLRTFLEGCINFPGIDANLRAGKIRALALDATEYATGATITFVAGVPGIPMWKRAQRVALDTRIALDHVMASTAIPLIFPAVRIDRTFFCDGSVRQSYPLSPAIHLGAGRILAISAGTIPPIPRLASQSAPSAGEAAALLLNAVFLNALNSDAERLVRMNRLIAALPAKTVPQDGLRPIDLLVLRPSCNLGSIAKDYIGLLPRPMRLLLRMLGWRPAGGSEFLSYLLLEPSYTSRLVELGYSDAQAQWPAIEKFLEA